MMIPKISVIVPVFKVESYLRDCIESIISQTFTDWELLLVDDGSPDSSPIICDKYAEKDERIKVIHKLNGGVSSARNAGIDHAKGEWVTFIDADDYILPTFLDGLYHPLKLGEKVEFIHGGCCNVKNGEIIGVNQSYNYYVSSAPDVIFKNLRGLSVSKLFSLRIIRNWNNGSPLYFDEKMKIAEDMAFTLDYILSVNRYAFVPEIGYCYRIDNMSSATKSTAKIMYEQQMHSFQHLYLSTNNYIQKFSLTSNQASSRILQRCEQLQDVLNSLYISSLSKKSRIRELRKIFEADYFYILKYSRGNKSQFILNKALLKGYFNLYDFCMYMKFLIRNYLKSFKKDF